VTDRRQAVTEPGRYRLRPGVILDTDGNWLQAGVWYDGAIVGRDGMLSPPVVTLYHPANPLEGARLRWQDVEREGSRE